MDERQRPAFPAGRRSRTTTTPNAPRCATELGMGSVRAPLPLDVDRLVHEQREPPPDPTASARRR